MKFSTSGAEVVVTIGVDGARATVAVRDTGPGMEADDLPRLFKPFGRASTASSRGEKSTGLGLAISRRIVEGHGGTIGVESAVGHGSTFTFTVPLGACITRQ